MRANVTWMLALVCGLGLWLVVVAGAPPNQYHTADVTRTVFASAARTVTANSTDFEIDPTRFTGLMLFLDISAASGTTPTLDVKLQRKDPISTNYDDVPGGAFAQKTTTGTDTLVVYPGVAETANETVSDLANGTLRAVATIGGTTPSFTFSLAAVPVQ